MSSQALNQRKEVLFLKDGWMVNPNGDIPDNRPRRLDDESHYTSDVREKRNIRDEWIRNGQSVLVRRYDGQAKTMKEAFDLWMSTTNAQELLERPAFQQQVKALEITYKVKLLTEKDIEKMAKDGKKKNGKKEKGDKAKEDIIQVAPNGTIYSLEGRLAIVALTQCFIDIRCDGCALAVEKEEFKPIPGQITGPMQISMGKVLHQAEEVHQHGTTTMLAQDTKEQGTFTERYLLRYALIGFDGICNESLAALTGMSEEDFDSMIRAWWFGTRNLHSHSKLGMQPRFMVVVTNKEGNKHQFGNLQHYVSCIGVDPDQDPKTWESPDDYKLDISKLIERLHLYGHCIEKVQFDIHPDIQVYPYIPENWEFLNLEGFPGNVVVESILPQYSKVAEVS